MADPEPSPSSPGPPPPAADVCPSCQEPCRWEDLQWSGVCCHALCPDCVKVTLLFKDPPECVACGALVPAEWGSAPPAAAAGPPDQALAVHAHAVVRLAELEQAAVAVAAAAGAESLRLGRPDVGAQVDLALQKWLKAAEACRSELDVRAALLKAAGGRPVPPDLLADRPLLAPLYLKVVGGGEEGVGEAGTGAKKRRRLAKRTACLSYMEVDAAASYAEVYGGVLVDSSPGFPVLFVAGSTTVVVPWLQTDVGAPASWPVSERGLACKWLALPEGPAPVVKRCRGEPGMVKLSMPPDSVVRLELGGGDRFLTVRASVGGLRGHRRALATLSPTNLYRCRWCCSLPCAGPRPLSASQPVARPGF